MVFKNKEISGCLLVICIGLIFSLPLLLYGFPIFTADGRVHSQWATEFTRQLFSGDLYPRWIMRLNDGFGSPAFYYYPPTPFYITSFFGLFFYNDPFSLHSVGLSESFALILSGIFTLLWLKKIVSHWAAVVGAILYMLMPYHLLIDLYTRGSFAEFWAMTWIPLLLLSAHYVAEGGYKSIILMSVSYALFITSHLLTTLIFSPILLFYIFIISNPEKVWRVMVRAIIGLSVGIGLAAFFLVPALGLQWAVSMPVLTAYPYYNCFVSIQTILHPKEFADEFSNLIYLLLLSMFIIGLFSGVIALLNNNSNNKRLIIFWLLVSAFCVFMMTKWSNPIWELFSIIQIIQFPNRYGTILSIAIAALISLGLNSIKEPFKIQNVAFILTFLIITIGWLYFTISNVTYNYNNVFKLHIYKNDLLRDVPEYVPCCVRESLFKTHLKFQEKQNKPVIFENGGGTVNVQVWKPGKIVFTATTTNVSTILVHQYYYPAWDVTINNEPGAIGISNPDGLLQLTLPAGDCKVEFTLKKTPEEWIGIIISVSSIVFLILFYIVLSCNRLNNNLKYYKFARDFL